MMTNTTQPEVTQADEERASAWLDRLSIAVCRGKGGYTPLAEEFARHRLAHSTPASADQLTHAQTIEAVQCLLERGKARLNLEGYLELVEPPASDQEPVAQAQHVARYDDGKFHWKSGIAPRNCELYASPPTPSDRNAVLEARLKRWRDNLVITRNSPVYGDILNKTSLDFVIEQLDTILRTEPAAQVEGEG